MIEAYLIIYFQALPIYRDGNKGMLTPAALVDINNDKVSDIVIATFNRYGVIQFRPVSAE